MLLQNPSLDRRYLVCATYSLYRQAEAVAQRQVQLAWQLPFLPLMMMGLAAGGSSLMGIDGQYQAKYFDIAVVLCHFLFA